MALSRQLAWRFLRSSGRLRALRFFSWVSVVSILSSVLLFVWIDSLLGGLSENMRQSFRGAEAPLWVDTGGQTVTNQQLKSIQRFISEHPQWGLTLWQAREFEGLLQLSSQDALWATRVRSVQGHILQGKNIAWYEGWSAQSFTANPRAVVLGSGLAENVLQDWPTPINVRLTHPYADVGPAGDLEPAQVELVVAGTFQTGRMEFDDTMSWVHPDVMGFLSSDHFLKHHLFFLTKPGVSLTGIKTAWLQSVNAEGLLLKTWEERNATVLKALKLEEFMYMGLFTLIGVISAFNLIGVVTLFAINKSEDVLVLRCLGLSQFKMRSVFVWMGFLLGGIGTLLGVGLSLLTLFGLLASGWQLPASYGFVALPVAVSFKTVVMVLFLSPVLCALLGYVACLKLSKASLTVAMERV